MADEAKARRWPNGGWLTAGLSGVMVGIVTVIASVSLAALIFSGPLSDHLAGGVSIALISAMLIGLIVSLAGSCGVAIAIPQDRTAPILAIMAASIAGSAPVGTSSDTIYLNVVAAIVATTLVAGGFLLALGLGRAGGLMRFIPYSVLGGFFAGTGWLLVLGGLRVMTGLGMQSPADAIDLLDPGILARWTPGLGIAVAIVAATRFASYAVALPAVLFGGTALFFAAGISAGHTLPSLGEGGWLLGPFADHAPGMAGMDMVAVLHQADWSVVASQWSSLATILVISAVSILLTVSALELMSEQDIDVNRELRVAGIANLAAGVSGGMVGFHSLGISSLVLKMGARTRITGIVAALTCGLALWIGTDLLALLPRVILGGLLLSLGFAFLWQWLVTTWGKLPHGEYIVVPLILLIIASVGFIEGVLAGLLAALLLFVLNYSRTQMVRYALNGRQIRSTVERSIDDDHLLRERGEELFVLRLRGYLFFGTTTQLLHRVRDRIEQSSAARPRFVLLDFEQVTGIDSSATYAFHRMKLMARQNELTLLLTGLPPDLQERLEVTRLIENDDQVRSFRNMDQALEWYECQVLESAGRQQTRVSTTILQRLSERFEQSDQAEAFRAYLEEIAFPSGFVLIQQGAQAGDLFFLDQGEVSVYFRTSAGEDIRLRRTGAGTVIGELGFYLGTPRSASVVADCDGRAFRLTRSALERMETLHPQLASALHQFIAELLAERLFQATQTLDAVMN